MPHVIPTPFTGKTGKWLDFWHVELCYIVGEHAGRQARRCTNDLDHTDTACWQLNGKKNPAATATSITSNLVYPNMYICFLGQSICRHLTKKKKNHSSHLLAPGVQSFPQWHFSTSQFTAPFLKPSSTVQYTSSFCSCSVLHISLHVALQRSELNHCTRFPKHTCKLCEKCFWKQPYWLTFQYIMIVVVFFLPG